ncbi:hypothetical protein [Microbacterium sp. NPDC056569]|uniref:hypothetical protein n=1 Tax=Microbacterium sp. NPDC056569 TaxID=3345867 RepID=UPI00366D43CE
MSGEAIWGYVLSAVISAVVAILLTGKISAGLADRAEAKRLRARATRVLLVGPGREQEGWWYLSPEQIQDIAGRLICLSEDAIAIDVRAARAYGHAAQMMPVLLRSIEQWPDAYKSATKRIDDEATEAPRALNIVPDRVVQAIESLVERRDDALAAIATVYEELLDADASLARVGRWLAILDWSARPGRPRALEAALDYARQHLEGAETWREPSEPGLEAYRVQTIARQEIPAGRFADLVAARTPRRDITGDEPLAFDDDRYTG